ncbi:MAG TPA: hypothetical protein VGH28_23450 [Polyangiaceae bacterium]|jgi:coenzyme F420-reducing hydrogenase delta subunit
MQHVTTGTPDRARILRLAAAAGVDPRTIARALRDGVDSIRTGRDREAIRAALAAEAAADRGRP